eukprot:jgi/Galph1/420/GphlegSOOS_G5187.1
MRATEPAQVNWIDLKQVILSCVSEGRKFVENISLTNYYSEVYWLCSNPDDPQAEKLYRWLKKVLTDYVKQICREFINNKISSELKSSKKPSSEGPLRSFVSTEYSSLESPGNFAFAGNDYQQKFKQLEKYARQWTCYSEGLQAIVYIFSYLERSWIEERRKGGVLETKGVLDIYTLGVLNWKSQLFGVLNKWIIGATLTYIAYVRETSADVGSVQAVVDSLIRMGSVEAIMQEENSQEEENDNALFMYRNKFEKLFLEETSKYYENLGKQLRETLPAGDFIRKVETLLNEETRLAELFCHPSTLSLLRSRCEDALLVKHLDLCYSLCETYLRSSETKELRRIYLLLSRIPGALKPVQECLKGLVVLWGTESLRPWKDKTGSNLMPTSPLLSAKSLKEGDGANSSMSSLEKSMMEYDALSEQEAENFVNSAWNIYVHSKELVHEAFLNDESFVLVLEQSCNKFFNSIASAPNLLVRFCHKMLEKSDGDEEERENRLVRVTRLFRLLEEKDLFQRLYSVKLARRLIYGTSASNDAEEAMLSRLRETCGQDYVSQLQRMFTDCQSSREEVADFRASPYGAIPLGFDFSIMVLTAGSWPIDPSTSKSSKGYSVCYNDISSLPAMFNKAVEAFSEYYSEKFAGRRLMWLHSLSKVDIRANLWSSKPESKSWCELQVSLPQALILLNFNEHTTNTFKEICEETGLDCEEERMSLRILIECGILRVSPNDYLLVSSSKDTKEFQDIKISLNEDFSPKKRKMKLANLVGQDVNREENDSESSKKRMDEDRRHQIQACLVRIMKRHRRASFNFLMGEATAALRHYFIASASDIRQNLESLIDKDYIARVNNGVDIYEYVA